MWSRALAERRSAWALWLLSIRNDRVYAIRDGRDLTRHLPTKHAQLALRGYQRAAGGIASPGPWWVHQAQEPAEPTGSLVMGIKTPGAGQVAAS